MAKTHKSLRIEDELIAGVQAVRLEGESEAAAYNRVIEAGLTVLEADKAEPGKTAAGADNEPQEAAQAPTGADTRLVETLTATVDALREQLAVKDEQIAALTRLTDQAQQLHAAAEVKALDTAEGNRKSRGLFARLFNR